MLDKSGKNIRMDPLWWEISNTSYKKKVSNTIHQKQKEKKLWGRSLEDTPGEMPHVLPS